MWTDFSQWVGRQVIRTNRPDKQAVEKIISDLRQGKENYLIVYVDSPAAMIDYLTSRKIKQFTDKKKRILHIDKSMYLLNLVNLIYADISKPLFWGQSRHAAEKYFGNMLRNIETLGESGWYDWMSSTLRTRYSVVFHRFYNQSLSDLEMMQIEMIMTICENVLSWFLGDDFCVLCEHPTQINLDSHWRLHAEKEPALQFADGRSTIYALNGIRVPEHVIINPQLITIEEIDKERNAEIKRILLERYGLSRYIQDSGAVEVSQDAYGILYRKSLGRGFESPIQAVHVTCSTTQRPYWIPVPYISEFTKKPIKTAHEAVAWTFGLRKEEYLPDQES